MVSGIANTNNSIQMEQNGVLMIIWIAWNRTVLAFKLSTYAKLNCLKWNCFCMLNWTVWNWTVCKEKTILILNWIVWNITIKMYKTGFGIYNLP